MTFTESFTISVLINGYLKQPFVGAVNLNFFFDKRESNFTYFCFESFQKFHIF